MRAKSCSYWSTTFPSRNDFESGAGRDFYKPGPANRRATLVATSRRESNSSIYGTPASPTTSMFSGVASVRTQFP